MAYLPRTVMTGHGAIAMTRSATFPRKNFEKPRRPCVPTTMRYQRVWSGPSGRFAAPDRQ